ncbi:MAG: histidine phosphatase family protein [Phycisphaeraceae bacterium]|nr:histidine phosphatase family protein [Phycisphaerales bacterium]MCB9860934.1 histidine phosphatase family protein [Phycisphaeraceae bacterium]
MLLYVIRHGKTERNSVTGRDDDRVLLLRGVLQARWLADRLVAREHPPIQILSSPIMRAYQTAEAIAARCQLPLVLASELSTTTALGKVMELLNTTYSKSDAPVAIVGHNPTLSNLVSVLVETQAGYFELSTGECAVVELRFDTSSNQALIHTGACTLIDVMRMPN